MGWMDGWDGWDVLNAFCLIRSAVARFGGREPWVGRGRRRYRK